MRVAKTITLSAKERATLTKWSRGRSTPARLVQRAKIILAAAEGQQNKDIAAELRCTKRTVGIWRLRGRWDRRNRERRPAPWPPSCGPRGEGSGDHSQDDPGDSSTRDTVECENHGEGDGCQQRHREAHLA